MPFTAKYTRDQKDACITAALDKGVRPYTRISQLAESGDLTGEPFTIDPLYVGVLARAARKKRLGLNATRLQDQAPRDAVEIMRRRIVAIAEHHLDRIERKDKQGKATAREISDVIRVLRELAAVPGPDQARPVKPGDKIPGAGGKHNSGATTSGLAGAMLRDLHATPVPGAPHAPIDDTPKDTATPDPEHAPTPQHAPTNTDEPDSWMSEKVNALLAQAGGSSDVGDANGHTPT